MADFIEVHQLGKPRLVNLDWVEDIWATETGTQIYFAFSCPDATLQDFITTDESYDKIKRIIAYQRVEQRLNTRTAYTAGACDGRLAEVYQRIFGQFCDRVLKEEARDGNTIKLPREQEKNEWND